MHGADRPVARGYYRVRRECPSGTPAPPAASRRGRRTRRAGSGAPATHRPRAGSGGNRDAAARSQSCHLARSNLGGQVAVVVVEDLEPARLLGLSPCRVVAARYQDDLLVVAAHPDLVRIDPGIDRLRLTRPLAPGGPVAVDPVDAEPARIAERDEDVFGRDVGRHVDGAGRQRDRLAVRAERARCGIDAERGDVVLGPDHPADPRCAVARRDIEKPPRPVRPSAVVHWPAARPCRAA